MTFFNKILMNIKFCQILSIFNQIFDILKKETGNKNKGNI